MCIRRRIYPTILSGLFALIIATGWLAANGFIEENATAAGLQNSPKRYALIIGISKYKNGEPRDIDGCVNNVDIVRQALVDWGFSDSDETIKILKNEQATASAIVATFQSHLIANAAKDRSAGIEAETFYYFCGHGSQYPNEPNDDEENDGMDETFVAWDSRSPGSFDILDDEIADLRYELSLYTHKATYVLESCFSGTGTRNAAPDGAVRSRTDPDARKRTPFKRKHPQSKLAPDSKTYVEFAASHSSLESFSEAASVTAPEKPFSLMTKAYVQALNAARLSGRVPTNRDLVQEMRRLVAAVPFSSGQTPQLEGNRDAAVFGMAEGIKRSFIEIVNVDVTKGRVLLSAGAIQGILPGSQIALYEKGSDGIGDKGLIATGWVDAARSFESEMAIAAAEGKPVIPKDAVAVLATPRFGSAPFYIDVPKSTPASDASDLDKIGDEIRRSLQRDNLFETGVLKLGTPAANLAPGTSRVLKIGRGKPRDLFRTSAGTLETTLMAPTAPDVRCDGDSVVVADTKERLPVATDDVYYVYEANSSQVPLFGVTVRPDDPERIMKLANVLRARSLHASVSGIDFRNSSLQKYAGLRIETIPGSAMRPICRNGSIRYQNLPNDVQFKDITADGTVASGTFVRIRLRNISGEVNRKELQDPYAAGLPLYFAVIALTNKGEVLPIYGASGADEPFDDGREVIKTIRVDRPATSMRIVVFVTRKLVDFSFLELRGAARNAKSPLEVLLTRPGTRSNEGAAAFSSPGDWGIIHYELAIKE